MHWYFVLFGFQRETLKRFSFYAHVFMNYIFEGQNDISFTEERCYNDFNRFSSMPLGSEFANLMCTHVLTE